MMDKRLSDNYESSQIIKGGSLVNNVRGSIPISCLYWSFKLYVKAFLEQNGGQYSLKEN